MNVVTQMLDQVAPLKRIETKRSSNKYSRGDCSIFSTEDRLSPQFLRGQLWVLTISRSLKVKLSKKNGDKCNETDTNRVKQEIG